MNLSFTQSFAVPIITLSLPLVSVNGLIVRSFENANDWQIVFGRNLFFFLIMMVVLWISARGKLTRSLLQMGWISIAAGIFLGLPNTTIILALIHTTVANTLFTLSAYPLITAILGKPVSIWTVQSILEAEVSLSADGTIVRFRNSNNVDNSPFGVVAWLANQLNSQRRALKSDDVVTTGVMTDIYDAILDQRLIADYTQLRTVVIQTPCKPE